MTPTADTWGIPGQTFLFLYVALGVVVLIAARAKRRGLAARRTRSVPDLTYRPQDVAYLNGGPELAVLSALGSLRLQGVIAGDRGTITTVGHLPSNATDLERAVVDATRVPVPRSRLHSKLAVRTALDGIAKQLQAEGLLLNEGERRAVRMVGLWPIALAVFGVVRLFAGIPNGKPSGFLIVLVLVMAVFGVVMLARAPRRSAEGTTLLRSMRGTLDRFAPAQRPDWTVYGPMAAAMGVGLFGASAVFASDPAMAQELMVERMTAGSGWSGGYDGGSSAGSSSSCGGGSSSCGGGGSSCGGGGGCGGGGCGS